MPWDAKGESLIYTLKTNYYFSAEGGWSYFTFFPPGRRPYGPVAGK
jgi:hypothetical protein